ncbi:MAG: 50S ribosomal protein L21 [Methylohalobius sp.]|nr:50S ribosomal protein L21 [Methylohalobius sp.]
MYAVIQTGGKQYRVGTGQRLKIEKLDAAEGATVTFDKVLLLRSEQGVKTGSPYIEGSRVSARVLAHGRHPKIRIIKFKRRKHHMKRQGHRQYYTEVQITDIS